MTPTGISPPAVLDVESLSVSFGGNHVIRDLSFGAGSGFTGLIGPNGAGKTTLFNVITGYISPQRGRVLISGQDCSRSGPIRTAREGVARTFQTPKLVRDLTVLENIMLGLDGRERSRRVLFTHERDATERSRHVADGFGLSRDVKELAGSLPLAKQKLVEVARAFVSGPKLVLLDEPAAGLSAGEAQDLVARLEAIMHQTRLTVVIIEHDLALVTRLCPRVAVLHFGHVIADGTPGDVLAVPDVVDAYLGAGFAARSE